MILSTHYIVNWRMLEKVMESPGILKCLKGTNPDCRGSIGLVLSGESF